MTDRAGFCEGCGMPVCCDRLRAVIDAALEVVRMYDRESLDALDAAVRALDDGGAE